MKFLDRFSIILLNICIIIVALWISIIPMTKSKAFYLKHFNNNNLLQQDYSKEELEIIADHIINYFFGSGETFQLKLTHNNVETFVFSEQAVQHMADVKGVYIIGQVIALIFLILLVLVVFYIGWRYRYVKKQLLKFSLVAYAIIIILISAFLIWSLVDMKADNSTDYFSYCFYNAHHLFFPFQGEKFENSFFPSDDFLIQILDTNLFMNAGIRIGVIVGIVIIVWWTIIILFRKYYQKIEKRFIKAFYVEDTGSTKDPL